MTNEEAEAKAREIVGIGLNWEPAVWDWWYLNTLVQKLAPILLQAAGPRAEVSKITVTLAEEVLKEINNELDMAVNQEAFLLRRCYLNGTVKQLAEAVLSQPPAPKPVAVSDEVDSEE